MELFKCALAWMSHTQARFDFAARTTWASDMPKATYPSISVSCLHDLFYLHALRHVVALLLCAIIEHRTGSITFRTKTITEY